MQRHLWLLWLVIAGYLAYLFIGQDRPWAAGVSVLVLGYIAARVSPWWGGRSVRHAEVLERGRHRPGDVVIYWRPGCPYCMRLRHRLGAQRRRAIWVNVWQDPAASAFVRRVNDGDEIVPTVVIGGNARTNPDAAQVRQALAP